MLRNLEYCPEAHDHVMIETNLDIMDSNQTFGNLGLSDITAEFDMPGLVLEQGTGANWGAFSTPATRLLEWRKLMLFDTNTVLDGVVAVETEKNRSILV